MYQSGKVPEAKMAHTPAEKQKALMIVMQRGGLCASGPCQHKDAYLYEDGTLEGYHKLDADEVSKLKDILNTTDLTASQKKPFPFCESYVDGTDLVLQFPQKYGDQTFIPCELESPNGDEAFSYIQSLLDTHSIER